MSPTDKPSASAVAPPASAARIAAGADDAALTALSDRFLAAYLERDPVQATAAGEHRHDGRYPDVSAEGEADSHRFYENTLKELAALPSEHLSLQGRVDRAILENQLRSSIFDLDELHERAWNPMTYTGMSGMSLREELQKAPGFTERAYHDKLLSFGSPSMRHIRAIVTGVEP